jgi:hypothetical protein
MGLVDNNEIHKLFPLPSIQIRTRGIESGIILKFQTFYLKIYDKGSSKSSYIIQGYRYFEMDPIFNKEIQYFELRDFANRFTRDNYLIDLKI